jgi:Uri superfamily endonuclease
MRYVLWIILERRIKRSIGKLGPICFKKGNYFYVGSAEKNFDSRIRRHISKKKKKFWHIDHLLSCAQATIHKVCSGSKSECALSRFFLLNGFEYVRGFGCSDCKCVSHLFFTQDNNAVIHGLLRKAGLDYADTSNF